MWGRAVALTLAAAAAAAVATLPCIGEAEVFAGDAKVADSLLKSGKQALSKGDHEGAAAFFRKAFEESPELIEACWWRASALAKAGDKVAALAAYREYLTAFDDKAATGAAMSKEELRLKTQAEKAVDALAAGEKEFRKLEDAYVAALLSFAKENFVRDPGVSRKAVDAVLALRADDEQALALAEKLGGGGGGGAAQSGPTPPTGPFAAVKSWRDLIADRSFQGSASADSTVTSRFASRRRSSPSTRSPSTSASTRAGRRRMTTTRSASSAGWSPSSTRRPRNRGATSSRCRRRR